MIRIRPPLIPAPSSPAAQRSWSDAGRWPVGQPVRLRPGQQYRLVKRVPNDDKDKAIVRARTMIWWPRVTRQTRDNPRGYAMGWQFVVWE